MREMKKTAKALEKVCRVLRIALDIALIASLVCLGILAVGLIFDLNAEQIGQFGESIELGFIELKFTDAYAPDQKALMLHAGMELLVTLVYLAAARVAVNCVRDILKPMTAGEPFGEIVSARLSRLALLSLAMGVMANVIQLVSQAIRAGRYDLTNLLLSEKVAQVTLNFKVDLSFLLIFAALKLLSYVFRYGEELQRLSDETL